MVTLTCPISHAHPSLCAFYYMFFPHEMMISLSIPLSSFKSNAPSLRKSPFLTWPTVAHPDLPFSLLFVHWCQNDFISSAYSDPLIADACSKFWGYGKGPWEKVSVLGIGWEGVFAISLSTLWAPWKVFWPQNPHDSLGTSSYTFPSFKIANRIPSAW